MAFSNTLLLRTDKRILARRSTLQGEWQTKSSSELRTFLSHLGTRLVAKATSKGQPDFGVFAQPTVPFPRSQLYGVDLSAKKTALSQMISVGREINKAYSELARKFLRRHKSQLLFSNVQRRVPAVVSALSAVVVDSGDVASTVRFDHATVGPVKIYLSTSWRQKSSLRLLQSS